MPANLKYADQDLGAGIQAPFAVIGYKGCALVGPPPRQLPGAGALRREGQARWLRALPRSRRPLCRELTTRRSTTKGAYVDGSDSPPDCWSTDGQKPDGAAVAQAEPNLPRLPPPTSRGSRVNAATGAKGKACSDFRRWAVVPYEDIENVLMGGPMLLRIPPASLGGVGEYSDKLRANSVPYAAIATRVGFDGKEAFPKMTFQPYAGADTGRGGSKSSRCRPTRWSSAS